MNESIRGYATAVAGLAARAGASETLVSELRQLVTVLAGADELQWALTDTSVPVSGRRAIVEELLTGKMDGLAVRLVSFVVGADKPTEAIVNLRWVADFVESVHSRTGAAGGGRTPSGERTAAEVSFVLSLPAELIGPSVGRHGTHERVGGYGAAVFGVVHGEGRISEIEDEIFRFSRVVEGNLELRRALTDWNIPPVERASIVADLLESKADPVTITLVAYTLRAGNVGSLVALLDWLVGLAAAERAGRVGEVRTAVEISEGQVERMRAALRRAIGHDVELRQVVDPAVIGGAQITVGETVVDGTVRRKLEQARTALLAARDGR